MFPLARVFFFPIHVILFVSSYSESGVAGGSRDRIRSKVSEWLSQSVANDDDKSSSRGQEQHEAVEQEYHPAWGKPCCPCSAFCTSLLYRGLLLVQTFKKMRFKIQLLPFQCQLPRPTGYTGVLGHNFSFFVELSPLLVLSKCWNMNSCYQGITVVW